MSKKKIVFTDTMVRKLKPEESKYIRGEGNGFTIRIMPSGVKTWLYVYSIDDKRREMNLGSYPDVTLETARGKFEEARKKVKNGIDPLEEKEEKAEARRKAFTVADLVKEYIEKHAKPFKRSWEEDARILNREVLPAWGKRKAADIEKRAIVLLLEGIIERGSPGMSNNTFRVIRKMFNFAVERGILTYSPAIGVKELAPKSTRERALSADEIKTLWANLDNAYISDEIKRALKLVLVSAQRPGEVIGMQAAEIDGNWWTIPAERAKNGKTHRVYLTATALELIRNTQDKSYIFPCPHKGKVKSIERHAMVVATARNLAWPLTDAKGKPLFGKDGKPATENRLGIAHFTPHDLRRTAATFMAQAGEMDEVIDAVLNHAKQGVIKVYNQYRYDREKQAALETWERKLSSIISGKESKVIPIRAKKKVV